MIKFSEWLRKKETTTEMTATSSVGSGMTSTSDIAGFARPLVFNDDENKKTHLIRRIKKQKH